MKLKVMLKDKEVIQKIEGEKLGMFASHEWHRLISLYIPYRKGNLERNVKYKPWEITYLSLYAYYQYAGDLYVDPYYEIGGFTPDGGVTFFSRPDIKKINSGKPLNYSKEHNSKATREWDKAAIRDKQDKKLTRSVQEWVNNNI